MRFLAPLSTFSLKNYRIYLSFLLGISIWFLHLRILADRFYASHQQAGHPCHDSGEPGGALGYFFLLDRWMAPRFSRMARPLRWGYIGLSVLAGLFLLFDGSVPGDHPQNIYDFYCHARLLPSR